MEKLTKFSILMASLSVCLGGNLPISALEAINLAVENVEIGDQLSLIKNDSNAYLTLDTIDYKASTAQGVVSAPEGDWYLKGIVVAQMDYEQGVSEEEADANLASLTDLVKSQDGQWIVLYTGMTSATYPDKSQDIRMRQINGQVKINANKSDILYYGVEFAKVTEDGNWGESWWSRGKIDYRSCVHATGFDEEKMVCKRVEEEGNVQYVPQMKSGGTLVYPADGESVQSWWEEWRLTAAHSYEAATKELETMKGYYERGLSILANHEYALEGAAKVYQHYFSEDPTAIYLVQGVDFWKGEIAKMRAFYDKQEGSDTTEIEVIVKENETLKTENTTLREEKETLKTEKEEMMAENEALKAENAKLTQEKSDLEQKNRELLAENTVLREELEKNGNGEEVTDEEMLALKAKIVALEAENEALRQGQNSLMVETEELKKDLMNLGAENEEMDKLNAELTVEIGRMQDSQKTLESQIAQCNRELQNEKSEDSKGDNNSVDSAATSEEEVVVPVLGGEEARTSGFWWWLIPIVGLIGAVLFGLKRKFSRR